MTLSPVSPRVSTPDLYEPYQTVRQLSETLCQPLAIDDYGVQSMPDVSPPKWHLAHTTWFFETFLLQPYLPDYQVFHPQFGYLFNSYYEAVGERHPRPQRGVLSRPTVAEVYQYRAYVDAAMRSLFFESANQPQIKDLVQLGLHHEQQHQELLLTDLKHILATNPLRPAYWPSQQVTGRNYEVRSHSFVEFSGGLHTLDYQGCEFAFDNEMPAHTVYLQDFALANRLVTNGEYLEFMAAGGYQKPDYWLSEGWKTVQAQQWQTPLYWEQMDGQWWIMTLSGLHPLDMNEPVCHVSFFEADAYARWRGCRLPTEAEWEVAAAGVPIHGNLLTANRLHPQPAQGLTKLNQLYGDGWEWTQSSYLPYPGFRTAAGAVGEYNGKFMCNQMVLRGGSCVTPPGHIRPTYRNFFPPDARWQFSCIRLAR